MFEQVEAIQFYRKMAAGRTSPLLVECERPDGTTVEVVAKFSKGCSNGALVREAVMAMLASDLSLPVPAPYLVHISSEFIASIPDSEIARFLQDSNAFGFGSKRLPNGFGQWIRPSGLMSDTLEQQAVDIMALDCWLANSDRRVTNPNLLTNGREFAIFDHELALLGHSVLFWKEPWQLKGLLDARPPVEHVFFDHLRGRAAYGTDAVLNRLKGLTDERISDYFAALPASWIDGEQVATEAQRYIASLRDHSIDADKELKRALA